MRAAGLAIAAARAHLAIAAANRERWEIAAARDCWAIAAARACLANAAAPGDWGCVAAPGDWGCVAAPGDWGCVPPSPASWGALYPRRSVERGEKTNDTQTLRCRFCPSLAAPPHSHRYSHTRPLRNRSIKNQMPNRTRYANLFIPTPGPRQSRGRIVDWRVAKPW